MSAAVSSTFASKDFARSLRALLNCRDVNAVGRLVLDLCKKTVGAEQGFVATWDEPARRLDLIGLPARAFNGEAQRVDFVAKLKGIACQMTEAVIYDRLFEGRLVRVAEHCNVSLQNLLVAPILSEGKPIGVIAMGNKAGGFRREHAGLATDFAELAAVAIANLRAADLLGMFQALSDSSPIGIYILQDGKFELVNPQFQRLTGYDQRELLGKEALSIVEPEDRELVRECATKMLRGLSNKPYEYRIVNKAGEQRWIMETVASFQHAGERAVVGNFIDITERKHLEDQLSHLATHDPLTSLANRRLLEEAMDRAVARAKRGATSALLFMDIDNFKLVNDKFGHAAGDEMLLRVVQLMKGLLRGGDVLARVGGDEFAVLLDRSNDNDALRVGDRLRVAVCESHWELREVGFHLSLSIGVAPITGNNSTSEVIAQADGAMYRAKGAGGNQVVVSD